MSDTAMRDESKIPGEFRDIPLNEIVENPWNPQEMTDAEFNELSDSMAEGMIDPIQVVPLKDRTDGKKFMILGGEHRWKVAQVRGWETIPGIVITEAKFQDVDLQKFITLRMNVIHGKLNPEKFVALYEEMSKKYDDDSLQKLMGFSDREMFDKLIGGVKDGLRAAGMPTEMLQELSNVVEEIKTVDDLSNILNRLFTKYGDSLKYSFMVYAYGGKDHVYIRCDAELFKKVRELTKDVVDRQISIVDVMKEMFNFAKSMDYARFTKVTSETQQEESFTVKA